ncbi:MAG: hypothetical protein A2161_13875 [Candidatus Schekmanbacteria bacterium RBG_13_48_7]|uniref:Uncharacterized protein n=1 Tax=Candidatus Schekmanbacteria bacterium RBG_13_48_7 TaxID=1817878 RepID=A0A1F7S5U7_9BACT|nr:MAG: hypothetical protein A2161_13875 [Candidatus Schekmanbacteria bacterium RBG_13_48_7]
MKPAIYFMSILIIFIGTMSVLFAADIPFYAEEHLQKGNEYFTQQEYDLAVREYKDAILFAPEYSEAYFRLGYVYMVQNNFAEATKNLEKAVELRNNYMEAHYCLGQVYQKLKEPDKAKEHSLKAVELFDADTPTLVKLGTYTALGACCLDQKDWDGAIDNLKKAFDLDQKQVSILNNLAVAYIGKKDLASAKEYYEKAIVFNETYLPAYIGLAGIYKSMGETEKAVSLYERVIAKYPEDQMDKQIDPNNPTVRKLLGDIYMDQKKSEKAREQFEYLTKLQPKNADNYNDLGLAYDALKKYPEAIAAFELSQQLDPQNFYSIYNLAYTYENQNNMDKAMQILQDALDKGVSGQLAARIHFQMAGIQAMNHKNDMAYDHLKSAIEIDPSFVKMAKEDKRLKKVVNLPKFKQLLDKATQ